MMKRFFLSGITVLICSALAFALWNSQSSSQVQSTPAPAKTEEAAAQPIPTTSTPPAQAAALQEQAAPPFATDFSGTPRTLPAHHRKLLATSQPPAEPVERLPNSPFLTGEPVAPAEAKSPAEVPTPHQEAEAAAHDDNPLDWIELGAATQHTSQKHSQNSDTNFSHWSPLLFLLNFSHALTRTCGLEFSWIQNLQNNSSSSESFPLNRLALGLNYSPQRTFFGEGHLIIHGGLEKNSEATLADGDTPPAFHEYSSVNIYGGATWSKPINSLWSMDVQILLRQPLLKPDSFASYSENGWSIVIKPSYQLDPTTKIGFKLGYESKSKSFEWSSSALNARGRSTETDAQAGVFIRFSF